MFDIEWGEIAKALASVLKKAMASTGATVRLILVLVTVAAIGIGATWAISTFTGGNDEPAVVQVVISPASTVSSRL